MTSHSINDFQAAMGATGNDAVAKLVKVWESKNARRALRGSAMGLMAVSLAACGGSDSNDDGGNGGGETPVPEPKEFILTTTIDNVVGGEGADTIYGLVAYTDPEDDLELSTWTAGDRINGGAGYDTLSIVVFADNFDGDDGYGSATTVTNVERLLIDNSEESSSYFDVNGFDASLEMVELVSGYDGSADYYFYNLGSAVDLKVTGVGEDTTEQDVSVYFYDVADTMYAGDDDTFKVTVVDVGDAEDGDYYLYIEAPTAEDSDEAIENLDITVGGENGSAIEWEADDGLENVVIRSAVGSTAGLNLDLNESASLASIDASALGGDFALYDGISSEVDLEVKGAAGDNDLSAGIDTGADEQSISVTTNAGDDLVDINLGHADTVISISTGAGADDIDVSGTYDVALTISAGAGNDRVDVEDYAGASIDVGTGLDIVDITTTVTNLVIVDSEVDEDSIITISGFGTDDDLLIGIDVVELSVEDRVLLINAATAEDATLVDVLNEIIDEDMTGANEAVSFEFGGETYLFIDNGGDVIDGDEGLILFKGVSLDDLTDGNIV